MNWRRWIRAVTATIFGAATCYCIWRVEWFDTFRWGLPGLRLQFVYLCYVVVFATVGWFLAAAFTPRLR
jgi:hypothetical protein